MKFETEAKLIIDKIVKGNWRSVDEEIKEIAECLNDLVNNECDKCGYKNCEEYAREKCPEPDYTKEDNLD